MYLTILRISRARPSYCADQAPDVAGRRLDALVGQRSQPRLTIGGTGAPMSRFNAGKPAAPRPRASMPFFAIQHAGNATCGADGRGAIATVPRTVMQKPLGGHTLATTRGRIAGSRTYCPRSPRRARSPHLRLANVVAHEPRSCASCMIRRLRRRLDALVRWALTPDRGRPLGFLRSAFSLPQQRLSSLDAVGPRGRDPTRPLLASTIESESDRLQPILEVVAVHHTEGDIS